MVTGCKMTTLVYCDALTSTMTCLAFSPLTPSALTYLNPSLPLLWSCWAVNQEREHVQLHKSAFKRQIRPEFSFAHVSTSKLTAAYSLCRGEICRKVDEQVGSIPPYKNRNDLRCPGLFSQYYQCNKSACHFLSIFFLSIFCLFCLSLSHIVISVSLFL